MRDLKNIPNITPVDSNYPHGAIKDTNGADQGTPVIEAVYGDIVQNTWRALDVAGVTANGSKDNVTNGFQILKAYERLFGVPIGAVEMHMNAFSDNTYLYCDGQEVLRSAYPELFGVIGTEFGGDGSTTFRLPDFAGRMPQGDKEDAYQGRTGGQEAWFFVLTMNNIPAHNHTFTASGDAGGVGTVRLDLTAANNTVTTSTAGYANPESIAVETMPPYMRVRFYIKAKYRF